MTHFPYLTTMQSPDLESESNLTATDSAVCAERESSGAAATDADADAGVRVGIDEPPPQNGMSSARATPTTPAQQATAAATHNFF